MDLRSISVVIAIASWVIPSISDGSEAEPPTTQDRAVAGENGRLRPGDYGRLSEFITWKLTLHSPNGSRIDLSIELRQDAVYTRLIEMTLADGRVVPFRSGAIPAHLRQHEREALDFSVLVPVPEEFGKQYGNWQTVDVTLRVTDRGAQVRATTPAKSLKCRQCKPWEGYEARTFSAHD